MAVLNDPFPHDEVTGLAAFENLPPVNSIATSDDDVSESAAEAPSPRQSGIRRDPTIPLGRRPWVQPGDSLPPEIAEFEPDQDESDPEPELEPELKPEQERPADEARVEEPAPLAAGGADHLFDDSARGQWEDDNATRVHESGPVPASTATHLQMDWDEDEPPTHMEPGAIFEAAAPSVPQSEPPEQDPLERAAVDFSDHPEEGWDEADASTQLYSRARVFSQTIGLTGAAQTMSGGQPSPFPLTPPNRTLGVQSVSFDARRETAVPERLVEALRAGDRRAWGLVGAVAVGLLALVLIVRAFATSPSVGSIVVATEPADAKIVIDNRIVPGTSSPYSVADLAPGNHTIVASKAGFADYQSTFVVAAGETKTLPPIALARTEVGFDVRSTPTGAAVWLDGQATNRSTPTRMTGIAPGIHRLQLKKPGYADFELQLFVPDATVLQLPDMALVELPANEHADRASDRRAARAAHDDGEESAAASRRSWRASRASLDNADDEAVAPRRAARTLRAADAAPARESSAPVAAASATGGRYGTLRLNTRPWSQVQVDGRAVGNTPLQGLMLSAGSHKVQLVNPAMGMSKTIHVNIAAGETVTRVLNLAD